MAWPAGAQPPPGGFDALAAAEARMGAELPEVLTTGCEWRAFVCCCISWRWLPSHACVRLRAAVIPRACTQGALVPPVPPPNPPPQTLPNPSHPATPPDVNYLDIDLDRWQALARYAGPNAARLVAVKQAYDPEDFFRTPWSVPLQQEAPSAEAAARDAREREAQLPQAAELK